MELQNFEHLYPGYRERMDYLLVDNGYCTLVCGIRVIGF